MINIKGLDKAKVLKALYDASHVQGMGFLQAVPDGTVTVSCSSMAPTSTTCTDGFSRLTSPAMSSTSGSMSVIMAVIRLPEPFLS